MAKQRYLKNAPITEAMIDIRVKLPKEFQIEEFTTLKESLSDRYPKVKEQHVLRGHNEIKDGQPILHSIEDLGIRGYFFRTHDEKDVVQFRIDGFTFNRLQPYTKWEDMLKKAQELWPLYSEIATPEAITRLAVRYINHLRIPLPFDDFSDYLNAPPNIPEELPQAVINFLNRVTIYDSTHDIAANITQSLENITQPNNFIIVILDIDVFKQGDFPTDNQEIWKLFEKLREMKNLIFFNSITENAVRLFE
jgi:uncharacterized protein (TIGR04255 family)